MLWCHDLRNGGDFPAWFWYKHNGIIVFADHLHIDQSSQVLTLRNPQIVNGGQTLKALFLAFIKNNKAENSAKVFLRAYRLPYEDTETHKRSIDIIAALNSQNKINPSDLRSTDPRQVRIEQLFEKVEDGFKYLRKRKKDAKAAFHQIKMTDLALRYYVCKKNAPHEGVTGQIEELFEEDSKYNEVFNEDAINKDFGKFHVIVNYATIWIIDQILKKLIFLKEMKNIDT